MDKNVITRIETNKRYVTDIELRALSEVLGVSYAKGGRLTPSLNLQILLNKKGHGKTFLSYPFLLFRLFATADFYHLENLLS